MAPADTTPRRRWFQFSLRTLLILVAVVASLAFAWMKAVEQYRFQREAMAVITKLGGTYKTENATGWARFLDRNAQDVVEVAVANCDEPYEYLPQLARLPKLRTLVIGGASVGNEELDACKEFKSLRQLALILTSVTDEELERFRVALPGVVVYVFPPR